MRSRVASDAFPFGVDPDRRDGNRAAHPARSETRQAFLNHLLPAKVTAAADAEAMNVEVA